MNNLIKYTVIFVVLLSSCNFLEPYKDNTLVEEDILGSAALAEGFLMHAYRQLPDGYEFSEVATDDAVSNDPTNNIRRMGNGEWSQFFYPIGRWDEYEEIFYINKFLSIVDDVTWSTSETESDLQKVRLKGESYGLRAYYHFRILQAHAGMVDNQLMGIPILDTFYETKEEVSIPRSSFEDCINQIVEDAEKAIAVLPNEYVDVPDNDSAAAFGEHWENRFNRLAAMALKSRVLLWAASDAFNDNAGEQQIKWEAAALAAAAVIEEKGGIDNAYFPGTYNAFWSDKTDPNILWQRGDKDTRQNNTLEKDNFPPSLYGKGRINPSQNLVDAFPKMNGYPIDSSQANYDSTQPYVSRDIRMDAFIVRHGGAIQGSVISTITGEGGTGDGVNDRNTSTRTGYYLKKFLRDDVSIPPNQNSNQPHYLPYFRIDEVILNFAEAANEVWGADVPVPGVGFSAVNAISKLRFFMSGGDLYLNSVAANDDAIMRDLIRNERRIQLCFEGFRFWDLRRWKSTDLNTDVRGVKPYLDGSNIVYEPINQVEARDFSAYPVYGPIPYNETLKYDNIRQNDGW